MNRLTPYDTKPWYRQFWPWFLIVLPGTVVVAALTTVFIAFNNADSRVNDEYYSNGLAIEQIFAYDLRAKEYGLGAQFLWDTVTGEIVLTLTQEGNVPEIDYPAKVRLQFLHPGNESMDQEVTLSKITKGYYRADLETLPLHRYYLRLSSIPDKQANIEWRLQAELDFSQAQQIDFHYR